MKINKICLVLLIILSVFSVCMAASGDSFVKCGSTYEGDYYYDKQSVNVVFSKEKNIGFCDVEVYIDLTDKGKENYSSLFKQNIKYVKLSMIIGTDFNEKCNFYAVKNVLGEDVYGKNHNIKCDYKFMKLNGNNEDEKVIANIYASILSN